MQRLVLLVAILALVACQDANLPTDLSGDRPPTPDGVEEPSGYGGIGTGAELSASETNLWFNNAEEIDYSRPEWMGDLPDDLPISALSIPGSHDAMARFGGPAPRCHTLTLEKQLNAGIRAFDIRLRHVEDVFAIHHGAYFQNAFFGNDVLQVFIDFLAEHPSETIVMRAKREHNVKDVTRSFGETFAWYMSSYGHAVWQTDDPTTYPTLGEVRGKIVILQNCRVDEDDDGPCDGGMFAPVKSYGLPWHALSIQDDYKVYWTHVSMNGKWDNIRQHLTLAAASDPSIMFANFTSGSTGMNPVDVARGIWIPFKFSDGMNERTYRFLRFILDQGYVWRTGLVLSDFPGPGLIDVIVAHNGLPLTLDNAPPVAVAGGPYAADEGSPVTFDASGSSDAENEPLQYRWDFDGDGTFDTDWSSSPTATHTWFDDYEGTAQVEVTDGHPTHVDRDVAQVTVHNVAPAVTIDSLTSPVPGCILPGQPVELFGSFTDPGNLDLHSAAWDFGDGMPVTGTLTEEHAPPDATGTVRDVHVYGMPGSFTVTLEVADDDGGVGEAGTVVRIMTAEEAVDFIDEYIQQLPASSFKKPADQRKNALSNKLEAMKAMLGGGNPADAVTKLYHDIRAKMDAAVGGTPGNDWIVEPEAQEALCVMIDELIAYLETVP
jgi:PKD repeat protein